MAPRFAYGMTPVGNPPASKYCWFKLRRIERCVPLVPTYSAVNTLCQGICRSMPRLHWSTSGCTLLGFRARRRIHLVFAAGTFKQHIETTVSRPHHPVIRQAPGKADAGGKVVLVGFYQRAAHGGLGAARGNDSSGTEKHTGRGRGGGIRVEQVGHAVGATVRPGGIVIAQAEIEG